VGGVRSACSRGNVRLSVLTAVLFVLGICASRERQHSVEFVTNENSKSESNLLGCKNENPIPSWRQRKEGGCLLHPRRVYFFKKKQKEADCQR